MTKKKVRNDQDEQFVSSKSKNRSKQRVVKQTTQERIKNQRKQNQKIIIFNTMRLQDRKIHQEKYKENLIAKKIEQEKRGFLHLKYQDDADSQLAQIDQDSVQRREENSTIQEIKELLEKQELALNKHHLCTSAENQFFKVQKLTSQLAQKQKQNKEQKRQKQEIQKHQGSKSELNQLYEHVHIGGELIKDGKSVFGKDDEEEPDKRTIVQKISDLDLIYY